MNAHPSHPPSHHTPQEGRKSQRKSTLSSSLRFSSLCGVPLLAFILKLSSLPLLHAAPPPELTVLRQQYDKAHAERVTAVFDASKAALDTKFIAALENAIATAKASGDLPTVLAIQEDKKAIEAKQDLPADADTTPTALKTLRTIYREQVSKLTEQRTANTAALLTPYAAKLQQLEATLTKNDRVEEAKEVMDYRVGLKADANGVPAVAMTTSTPATPATPATTPSKSAVKGDDRKAAEWVLAIGGTIMLHETSKVVTVPAELPKGRFTIRSIDIDNNSGKIKPVTETDFQCLAGLENLDRVTLNKLPVTAGVFGILVTCPNLTQVQTQYNRFGDDIWGQLSTARKLAKVVFQFDSVPVTGVGISKLNAASITTLFLNSLPITDEALPEIATLTKLEELFLEEAKVTDAGLQALSSLKQLKILHLHNTGITAAGFTAFKGCPIINLSYGRTASEVAVQAAEVAILFPKIEGLKLPRESVPTTEDWTAIAKSFPKLSRVSLDSHKFADTHLEGIDALPELSELDLHYAKITDAGVAKLALLKKLHWLAIYESQITDAALEILSGMKKLKTLKLPKPGNGVTEEGVAKFKKQRPDVKLN
jgi:hypothetical protein